jgi:hypothetical protein
MNVLVVELSNERRAALLEALCELRGVEVRVATSSVVDAQVALSTIPIDAVIIGALPAHQRAALARVSRTVSMIDAQHGDIVEVARRVRDLAAREEAHRPTETLVLGDWLPGMADRLRMVLPETVALVPMIAASTPPVQCVPHMLEKFLLEAVLEAARALLWGGTIWLAVDRADADEVRIDVIDDGHGRVRDLTLRVSASALAS